MGGQKAYGHSLAVAAQKAPGSVPPQYEWVIKWSERAPFNGVTKVFIRSG
jgi:hypothetical protein